MAKNTDKMIFPSPPRPPERVELSDNPVKLCNEITRIVRTKLRELCDIDGIMSQPGARLVLSFLAVGDGVSQRELVERSHRRAPTVSVIVKKMIDEGLAYLGSDGDDRRVKRVYLTDKGRLVDREGINNIREIDSAALAGLSAAEQQLLMELLCRMRENLLADSGNGECKTK